MFSVSFQGCLCPIAPKLSHAVLESISRFSNAGKSGIDRCTEQAAKLGESSADLSPLISGQDGNKTFDGIIFPGCPSRFRGQSPRPTKISSETSKRAPFIERDAAPSEATAEPENLKNNRSLSVPTTGRKRAGKMPALQKAKAGPSSPKS